MNQYLAEMYGTNGAGEAAPDASMDESATKVAQMELFAKVAADNNVDLTQLSPEQVSALWDEVMPKLAESEEDEEEDEEDEEDKEASALQAQALAEFEQKKEAQSKLAEAELMGQVMAHSFVRELNEIEKEAGIKEKAVEYGRKGLEAARGVAGKASDAARSAASGAASRASHAGKAVSKATGVYDLSDAARIHKKLGPGGRGVPAAVRDLTREGRNAALKRGAGKAALTAGGVGAVGYGAHKATKKEASAFDTLAAENAIKIASEAGYDAEDAAARLNALFTLDQVQDSEKIAYVDEPDAALHVRSLELLESIGAPVNWDEVFGS